VEKSKRCLHCGGGGWRVVVFRGDDLCRLPSTRSLGKAKYPWGRILYVCCTLWAHIFICFFYFFLRFYCPRAITLLLFSSLMIGMGEQRNGMV
jgi:hypothetical protein